MTRQDFQLIADVLRTNQSAQLTDHQRQMLALDLADALAETNPRFRHDVFLAACGLGPTAEELGL